MRYGERAVAQQLKRGNQTLMVIAAVAALALGGAGLLFAGGYLSFQSEASRQAEWEEHKTHQRVLHFAKRLEERVEEAIVATEETVELCRRTAGDRHAEAIARYAPKRSSALKVGEDATSVSAGRVRSKMLEVAERCDDAAKFYTQAGKEAQGIADVLDGRTKFSREWKSAALGMSTSMADLGEVCGKLARALRWRADHAKEQSEN